MFLEIDNRQCAQNSDDCFSNTDQAASYIAAEYVKRVGPLPYPLVSVSSEYPSLHLKTTSGTPKLSHS